MTFIYFIVYVQCDENLCMNGATCQIVASDYICLCVYGFIGPFCNTSKNIIITCMSINNIFIFLQLMVLSLQVVLNLQVVVSPQVMQLLLLVLQIMFLLLLELLLVLLQ